MGRPVARLAQGLAWPEGPTVLPDGRVAFVETYRSHVAVYDPTRGVSQLVFTGGGPNATALGADGHLYVTQNGGVVGPWRAEEMRPPSIQRVSLDGRVEIVATEIDGVAFQAPNDLAFGPDGRLCFTDPGRFDQHARPDPGYVFALAPDGSGEVLAELEPCYPNGIAVEIDGSVVWVETYSRLVRRRRVDGTIETLLKLPERSALLDGFKVAADGDLYITTGPAGTVDVIAPDGTWRESLAVGANPTNCAFAGTRLYVTDGGHSGESGEPSFTGALLAVELEVSGMDLFRGRIDSSDETNGR